MAVFWDARTKQTDLLTREILDSSARVMRSHGRVALQPLIYPERWEHVCKRVLLRFYESLPADETRRGTGKWGIVRNIIMKQRDADSADGIDKSLTRQDLEGWIKNDKRKLSITKMDIVSGFVREVLQGPDAANYMELFLDINEELIVKIAG